MSQLPVPPLPVLIDEGVWPEFGDAIRTLGAQWTAPSGRAYLLDLHGTTLRIDAADPGVADLARARVEADLFALACEVADLVGGEWSAEALRTATSMWGFTPDPT